MLYYKIAEDIVFITRVAKSNKGNYHKNKKKRKYSLLVAGQNMSSAALTQTIGIFILVNLFLRVAAS